MTPHEVEAQQGDGEHTTRQRVVQMTQQCNRAEPGTAFFFFKSFHVERYIPKEESLLGNNKFILI